MIPQTIEPNPYDSGDWRAFYNCSSLETVVLECGFIGRNWFENCTSLRHISLLNVTNIASQAFRNSGLTAVRLEKCHSSSAVSSYRFADCANLEEVGFEDGFSGIGGHDFYNCTALKDICIPADVKYIGPGAFAGCTSLTNAVVLGCTAVAYNWGDDGIFDGCRSLKTVTIGDGVTMLSKHMFNKCYSLERVTFGVGVTNLPSMVFEYCPSLREVVFEGNAPTVAGSIFWHNAPTNLTWYVHRGSTGWGVEIPGIWHEHTIRYIEPASYTVTFNANGGSGGAIREVEEGECVGALPPDPIKSGYTFAGWWTSASGGTRVTASTVVYGNVTYYAHWTANVVYYTVTFDANGGYGGVARTVAGGSLLGTLPPDPTKNGYTFAGWWTNVSGGTKVTASTKVNGNVTYYAHWTAVSAAKPNLKIDTLTACRRRVFVGETFHLRYTVKNSGNSTAGASYVGISDKYSSYWSEKACNSLIDGAEQVGRLDINSSLLGVGSHTITVTADRYGQVQESSETDNTRTINLEVIATSGSSSALDWQFKNNSPAAVYMFRPTYPNTPATTFKQGETIYVQMNFWNAIGGDVPGGGNWGGVA